MNYIVIKDIPDGWQGTAKVGDVLTVGKHENFGVLMLGSKAICDVDSVYALEYCDAGESQ